MKGSSTGCPPIHVSKKATEINDQNIILFKGYEKLARNFDKALKGNTIKIRMEATNAITPPNLLGIDRRMA